jgi:hypothetical protein
MAGAQQPRAMRVTAFKCTRALRFIKRCFYRIDEPEGEMVKLGIDLQEGFDHDTVILRLNGVEAFHKEGITTRRILGLAAQFEDEVEPGFVETEIDVSTLGISARVARDMSKDTYLGVSIVGGMIHLIDSEAPFVYA